MWRDETKMPQVSVHKAETENLGWLVNQMHKKKGRLWIRVYSTDREEHKKEDQAGPETPKRTSKESRETEIRFKDTRIDQCLWNSWYSYWAIWTPTHSFSRHFMAWGHGLSGGTLPTSHTAFNRSPRNSGRYFFICRYPTVPDTADSELDI